MHPIALWLVGVLVTSGKEFSLNVLRPFWCIHLGKSHEDMVDDRVEGTHEVRVDLLSRWTFVR